MVGPCSETFSDSVALLNSSVATGTYRPSPEQGLRAAHEFRFEARLDKRRDTSSFRGGWDLTRNACQPSSSCARSGSSEAGALPQAISVASEGAARRSARDPAGAPGRSSPPRVTGPRSGAVARPRAAARRVRSRRCTRRVPRGSPAGSRPWRGSSGSSCASLGAESPGRGPAGRGAGAAGRYREGFVVALRVVLPWRPPKVRIKLPSFTRAPSGSAPLRT